jgi:hypothetical protein
MKTQKTMQNFSKILLTKLIMADLPQELHMVAMFANRSGRNEQSS